MLTAILFAGSAVYDPEIDALRPANKAEPLPLATAPELDLQRLPSYPDYREGLTRPGRVAVDAAKQEPEKRRS